MCSNWLSFPHKLSISLKLLFISSFVTSFPPKLVTKFLECDLIVFEEISHVIQNKKGIFVSKRDTTSLSETIKKVMENYSSIQKDMLKNKLPTKEEFIKQMSNILNLN